MTIHKPCGTTWTGLRLEHCAAAGCCQTFSGTILGDKHRVGHHGVDRRCLTPDEMRAKGWHQDDRGIWHGVAGSRPTHWRGKVTA